MTELHESHGIEEIFLICEFVERVDEDPWLTGRDEVGETNGSTSREDESGLGTGRVQRIAVVHWKS